MLKLKYHYVRKTYYSSPQSEQALAAIKDKYPVNTDSDAIRLALTLVAESPIAQLPKRKGKIT